MLRSLTQATYDKWRRERKNRCRAAVRRYRKRKKLGIPSKPQKPTRIKCDWNDLESVRRYHRIHKHRQYLAKPMNERVPKKQRQKMKQWRQSHKKELAAYFRAYRKRKGWRLNKKLRLRYQQQKARIRALRRKYMKGYWKIACHRLIEARNRRRAKGLGADASRNRKRYIKFLKWARHHPEIACHWCGTSTKPGYHRHVDHIRALSKGGRDDVNNLCVACGACNCAKGNKSRSEWIRYLNATRKTA